MEIITHATDFDNKIFYQANSGNISTKRSIYNVEVTFKDNVLLYNVYTQELISLSLEEYSEYLKMAFENNNLKDYLISHMFLLPIDTNEKALVDTYKEKRLSKMRQEHSAEKIDLATIFTTTACNARCPYCYESDIVKNTMSDETALDVAKYIEHHANNKRVTLKWFGGEPLLNSKAMDIICDYLQNNGIEYSSRMISNGYLLNSFSEEHIKSFWKLKSVQITLDGTHDNYNKIKGYVNPSVDPFVQVIKNIEFLISIGVNVSIRSNLSKENSADIRDLMDYLKNHFGDDFKKFHMYVNPVYEGSGNPPVHFSQKELNEIYTDFQQLTLYRNELNGNSDSKIVLRDSLHSLCMANGYGSSPCIMPDGKLSICEHYSPDNVYGDIWHDDYDSELFKDWEFEYGNGSEKCKECFYYPQCIRTRKCTGSFACSEKLRELLLSSVQERMKRNYKQKNSFVLVSDVEQDTHPINCVINEEVNGK